MTLRALPLVLAIALPLRAAGDRGAFSVEAGGLGSLMRVPAAAGTGGSVNGSVGGATVGFRYAIRNDLELSLTSHWFAAAPFYVDGTTLTTPNGVFSGQLQSRVSRLGFAVGADYVRGLVLRAHVGADIGWSRVTFRRLDLVNVGDPSTPQSYGLSIGDRTLDGLLLAPRVGIEWAASDRLSFTLTPRLELVIGTMRVVAVTTAVTISYSWYGLVRS